MRREATMLMHGRRTAIDNDAINLLQRAYHGICWSAGIYPYAHSGDTRATAELRGVTHRRFLPLP